jgi:predicted lipoprotein
MAGTVLLFGLMLGLLPGCRKTGGVPGLPLEQGQTPGSGGSGSIPPADGGPIPLPDASSGEGGFAGEAPVTPPFSREALLESFANCALNQAQTFLPKAEGLVSTSQAYAATPADDVALAAARVAWVEAIDVWQRLELLQFGPAGPTSAPGGQGLRTEIYAWAAFNRCWIEQQIISQRYLEPEFGKVLPSTRGLGAIEYLLFYEGTDNACPATQAINTSGAWGTLDPAELRARKAAYAHAAAVDVLARAQALVSAWQPDGGNFFGEFVTAGAGSSVYPQLQSGFNTVSDALFYLDTEVKDMKVLWPLGADCSGNPCPTVAESPYTGRSKAHVRNNLIGFRLTFQGCQAGGHGLGFDDLLSGIGQGALADTMRNALAAAIAAVDAIEEPSIEAAAAADRPSVEALHAAIRGVTTPLKTEFMTVLDLTVPMRAGSDND